MSLSLWPQSTLAKKYLMALTGLGLIGFAVAHLLGNLQIFAGPDKINGYAATLKNLGPLLWFARLNLLATAAAHIKLATELKRINLAARPVGYEAKSTLKATLTSRTMIISGIMLLAYVIFHLMHYTLFVVNPEFAQLTDAQGRHDVYRMLILGFQNPVIATSYIVAMIALGWHIQHGASSVFQSLGLNTTKWAPLTQQIGPILATAISVGYIMIPLGVWLGWVK